MMYSMVACMHAQPARWLTVGLGGTTLTAQLLLAPTAVVLVVVVGAVPALLYGMPIHGRRLRELPAVKPFFVSGSLAVAAVAVPTLWALTTSAAPPAAPRVIVTGVALFALVLCNVCFFDVRDRETDAGAGVRTIPVCLGVSCGRGHPSIPSGSHTLRAPVSARANPRIFTCPRRIGSGWTRPHNEEANPPRTRDRRTHHRGNAFRTAA